MKFMNQFFLKSFIVNNKRIKLHKHIIIPFTHIEEACTFGM